MLFGGFEIVRFDGWAYMKGDNMKTIIEPICFSDSEPPLEFCVLPYGRQRATKGGKVIQFDFSQADARKVVSEFADRKRDLVIDYEHQTTSGGIAPAAGWIESVSAGASGLMAKVKYWNDKAKDMLKAREYRMFSPVATFEEGKVSAIHSVALTNHPAIHGLTPLIASDDEDEQAEAINKQQEDNMSIKKIGSALGVAMPDGATDEEIVGRIELAINALKSKSEQADKVKTETVPMSDYDALKGKLSALQDEHAKIKSGMLLDKAKASGLIGTESMAAWAEGLATKDPVAFTDWMSAAEKAVVESKPERKAPPAGKAPDVAAPSGSVAFNDSDDKIYRNIGLSDKQISEIKKVIKE